jgi:uncharacterized protein with HEPN domain
MPNQRDQIRLEHMLAHAREAVILVQDKVRADLDNDRVLNLALVRLLEVIGEAAGRISKEKRARHPDIPWTQIIGMRNRLIHGYDSVDNDILWQILSRDLPPLVKALKRIVSLGENEPQPRIQDDPFGY